MTASEVPDDIDIAGEAEHPLTVAEICGVLERVASWHELPADGHWVGIQCTGGGFDHPGLSALDFDEWDYLILVSDTDCESIVHARELPTRLLVGPGGWGHGGDPNGSARYHYVPSHEEALAAACCQILQDLGIARKAKP